MKQILDIAFSGFWQFIGILILLNTICRTLIYMAELLVQKLKN